MTNDTTMLIELDGRRRVAFGKVGRPEHTRYLVTEDEDGTLILTPAVVISEAEARFHRHPELVARIEANRADPSQLVKRNKRR